MSGLILFNKIFYYFGLRNFIIKIMNFNYFIYKMGILTILINAVIMPTLNIWHYN
jgi:hypothetical protein